MWALPVLALLGLLPACGATPSPPPPREPLPPVTGSRTLDEEATAFLAYYDAVYVPLYTESARASWIAGTEVTEEHTGMRIGAETTYGAFIGNARIVTRARELLEHRAELAPTTVRQLDQLLYLATGSPQTNPDLSRRKVAAEGRQSALLDGFQFCLERRGNTCRRPTTTNEIDRILQESTDMRARLGAWEASKAVGATLRDGIVELRDLRNAVAREMGYADFFAYKVSSYGMTSDEMMALLDRLLAETRPLFDALQCWARHELARRYRVADVPELIPAHFIGNRWAQAWPGLVTGVDNDALVANREPTWIVETAERFYVSMGFPELPETFWERSDLFPVPEGETREKNDHASAWHVDLEHDVRSLMSVEPTWRWFGTTHHELGHIYYYLAYARPEVPPLLREGANRAFHEGIGNLIELASGQTPYLAELGLVSAGETTDPVPALRDRALTGPIVFLPFAAGTMSHFEKELYSDGLPVERFQDRWWELVATHQGVAPPSARPADGCDACTKTHINDDPAEYYDYALAEVLVYQLHDHICRELLHQDPRACNYYGRREVGTFLQSILSRGATEDWRVVLEQAVGSELSAAPMLEYYRPLLEDLERANHGRSCAAR